MKFIMFCKDAAVLINMVKRTAVIIAPAIIFPVLRYEKLQINDISKNVAIEIGIKKPK